MNTNNMKSTWPMPAPRVGDPIRPIFHLLLSLFGIRVGGNATFRVNKCYDPQREGFCIAAEYRLKGKAVV